MGWEFCGFGNLGNYLDNKLKCHTVAARIASYLINTEQPCCVQIKMMQEDPFLFGIGAHTLVGVFGPSYMGSSPDPKDWLLSIDGWDGCPIIIGYGKPLGDFNEEVRFDDPEVKIPFLKPPYIDPAYCTEAVKITGSPCPNFIKTGQQLDRSGTGLNALCSLNLNYKAVLEGNGNFVVYDMGTYINPEWATGTLNPASYTVKVQNDCNLVAYPFAGNVSTWATNNYFPEPCTAYVIMQNDGNLVACRSDHLYLWSSKYGIRTDGRHCPTHSEDAQQPEIVPGF